ncbi:MAG: hypothetical protein HY427_00415 [Candidatus Levybacteria bacterium]|nr:hypothetical protein [Candidatus Levybacteria bacterium]
MSSKKGIASNVIETIGEPVRTIKGDVKKQVGNISLDLVKMLYVDPEHTFKTEGELEQIKNRERMEKLEGFKQSRRELNAMQGKVVSEETIDEEARRYIEEEEKRLARSLQKFEISSREAANSLGEETSQEKEQVDQQRKIAEEEERKRKEAEKQARLENVVEAPPGKVGGLAFGKRKRTAPRMMRPPKSAESKAGRGVGG